MNDEQKKKIYETLEAAFGRTMLETFAYMLENEKVSDFSARTGNIQIHLQT